MEGGLFGADLADPGLDEVLPALDFNGAEATDYVAEQTDALVCERARSGLEGADAFSEAKLEEDDNDHDQQAPQDVEAHQQTHEREVHS